VPDTCETKIMIAVNASGVMPGTVTDKGSGDSTGHVRGDLVPILETVSRLKRSGHVSLTGTYMLRCPGIVTSCAR
jgi:hypothetical protein